jgi:cbb3-type cytochrome oxidase cytochrome c subunit
MHIAFGAASVLLLAATVWAFIHDHRSRTFPQYQSEYDKHELKRLRQEQADLADMLGEDDLAAELAACKAKLAGAQSDTKARESEVKAAREKIAGIDNTLQKTARDWNSAKAALDVLRYQVDAKQRSMDSVAGQEQAVSALFEKMRALEKERGAEDRKIAEIENTQADARKFIERHESAQKSIEAQIAKNIGNPVVESLRDAPGINFINPRRKIQQVVLHNLPLNLNFSSAPRVDRCVSCHQGIDNPAPMYDPLNTESDVPRVLRAHPNRELYVSPDAAHPYKRFGCTICHQGRGAGTDFSRAAHTPRNSGQASEWRKKYDWQELPFWDAKMLPLQHSEASCLKCHKNVDNIPQAPRLNAGRDLFRQRGCANCHMGTLGEKEMAWVGRVGPDLRRIGEKTNPEWTRRWIENPWSIRPSTRMPRLFGLENRTDKDMRIASGDGHALRDLVEVEAITTYLFETSKLREKTPLPAPPGDAAAGRELFAMTGCVACHATRELPQGEAFDISAHGPDLSRMGRKVSPGWLFAWLKNPRHYWAETKMPDMRLTDTEAANLTAYLMTAKTNRKHDTLPAYPESAFDAVLRAKLAAATPSAELDAMLANPAKLAADSLKNKVRFINQKDSGEGEWTEAQIAAVQAQFNKIEPPQERSRVVKAFYAGETLIQQHGCFGCHNIQGFTHAPLTGINLSGEADKDLENFDFGKTSATEVPRTKWDWFYAKIARPRVFDMGRRELVQPFNRLRMPWFGYKPAAKEGFELQGSQGRAVTADDPHADLSAAGNADASTPFGLTEDEVQALVTHLLSLTRETPPREMQHTPGAGELARDCGERVMRELNCIGCHTTGLSQGTLANFAPMPKTIPMQSLVALMRPAYRLAKPFYDQASNRIQLNEDTLNTRYIPMPGESGAAKVEGLLNALRGTWLTDETAAILLMEMQTRANPQAPAAPVGFSLKAYPAGRAPAGWVPYCQLVSEPQFLRMTIGIFFKDTESASKAYALLTPGDKPYHVNIDAFERLAGTQALLKNKEGGGVLSHLEIERRRASRQFYEPLSLKVRFSRGEGGVMPHVIAAEAKRGLETASEQNGPPKLNYEGGKVQPDWLYQFLHNIQPLRPGLNIRMPSFWNAGPDAAGKSVYPTGRLSAVNPLSRNTGIGGEPLPGSDAGKVADLPDDAADVVSFFTSEAGEKPFGSQSPAILTPQEATLYEQGRTLVFGQSGQGSGCFSCHSIGKNTQPEPKYAPDLAQVRNRLKKDWVRRFLIHPWSLHPKVNMPANFFDWGSYNGDMKDPMRGLQPDAAKFKEAAQALEAVHFYLTQPSPPRPPRPSRAWENSE